MPGRSRMEPIFYIRQAVENYRETKRHLYMVFIIDFDNLLFYSPYPHIHAVIVVSFETQTETGRNLLNLI